MTSRIKIVASTFCLLAVCHQAWAAGGVLRTAKQGQKLTEKQAESKGWSAGMLAVLNDKTRTEGWLPWFSGVKSDVEYFEFNLRTTQDVQRLVDAFAKVKAPKLQIAWAKGKSPKSIGSVAVRRNVLKAIEQRNREHSVEDVCVYGGKGTSALLSVPGKHWRKLLQEAQANKIPADALAKLSQHPTLTLYLDNACIDPQQIKVPPTIKQSGRP